MNETRKAVSGIHELRPSQEERFQRQMDLVFAGHPYYREIFARQGLTRGDFKGLDDLAKLPLTRKEDYIARPEEFRLRLEQVQGISREERAIWDIIYTSGFKPPHFIRRFRQRCQKNNRDLPVANIAFQAATGLKPINPWQQHIQQDQIRFAALDLPEGLLPASRYQRFQI